MTTHHPLIILGSGPGGCSAAIYAARAQIETLMIHGMQPGGQLTITTDVENYPGFADPIQGPWLMDQMHAQVKNCGAKIESDHIKTSHLKETPIRLEGESGETYTCDALIISTGASAKWLGLESEKKYMGKGVSGCATCDGSFFRNMDVLVVGGGNTAMEEALYLANMCKKVTIIHRRDAFRGEKILQQRVKDSAKIDIIWDTVLEEILGDGTPMDNVGKARVKNVKTGDISELDVMGIFIAIGHKPNTDLFKGQLNMNEYGYLQVPAGKVCTEIPGVFAAGDVMDPIYRQAVTSAGFGCMAALDVARYLEEKHAGK